MNTEDNDDFNNPLTSMNPILMVKPFSQSDKSDVILHEYEPDKDDESLYERYFSDIWTYKIVGIEQKNGTVIVFKNYTKLSRPLRNKQIFIEKYFTEAL